MSFHTRSTRDLRKRKVKMSARNLLLLWKKRGKKNDDDASSSESSAYNRSFRLSITSPTGKAIERWEVFKYRTIFCERSLTSKSRYDENEHVAQRDLSHRWFHWRNHFLRTVTRIEHRYSPEIWPNTKKLQRWKHEIDADNFIDRLPRGIK